MTGDTPRGVSQATDQPTLDRRQAAQQVLAAAAATLVRPVAQLVPSTVRLLQPDPLLAGATQTTLPPLPRMADGIRGAMIGSIPMASLPGDIESVQCFYSLSVNPGAKAGWTYHGQPDVHYGRDDTGRVPSVKEVYDKFLVYAKNARALVGKPLLVGRYIGLQTVRTVVQHVRVNRWPSHNVVLANFEPSMIGPPNGGFPEGDFGTINYSLPAARERALTEFLAEARGERGAPRPDMFHFDEAGYVPQVWPGIVEMLTKFKAQLNREGMLVSINLGGYGWRRPANFALNVHEQLPEITNCIQIEGIADRSSGGLESDELLLQITNLRLMLAKGLGFQFLLMPTPDRVLPYRISNLEFTTDGDTPPESVPYGRPGDKKLLVTLAEPALATFPLGGCPFDLTDLGNRSGEGNVPGVPVLEWSLYPADDSGQRFYLFRRDLSLEELASRIQEQNPKFRWRDLVGQPLYDIHSLYRVQAAFVLAACRDFNDCMWCHYEPQPFRPDTYAQYTRNGAYDWMRWPELLGPPLEADPRITATDRQGNALELRRRFKEAELVWLVKQGAVRFAPLRKK